MTMIDSKMIQHLATLSRLEFSDDELVKYSKSMSDIFDYANRLQKVDTTNIDPSAHAIKSNNIFREDTATQHPDVDSLLANGPDIEGHAFKVPRILVD